MTNPSEQALSNQEYEKWGWNKTQIAEYEADMKKNKAGALQDIKKGDTLIFCYIFKKGIVRNVDVPVEEVSDTTITARWNWGSGNLITFDRSTGRHASSNPDDLGWITTRG